MLAIFTGIAVKESGGNLVLAPNAVIEVRRKDTGRSPSIFSDEAGTTPITNPSDFTAATGKFEFYAAGLERGYTITGTDGALIFTLNNVAIGTAAQFDADVLRRSIVLARSANTILGSADLGRSVVATSSFTQTLDAAATLGDGWFVSYKNDGVGTITLDPNASELINGAATLALPPGHGGRIRCNGSAFFMDVAPSMDKGQIKFPSTQNASSDANTFDDYEEGTWTPVLTFVTPGNLAVSYSQQSGFYIKLGQVVSISWTIFTSTFTHTTASGNSQVTGVPFASLSGTDVIGALGWQGITKANYTSVVAEIVGATAVILMLGSGSGQGAAQITTADMPTAGSVLHRGELTYRAGA